MRVGQLVRRISLFIVLIGALSIATLASAQSPVRSVSGTVFDPLGAAVPGTSVILLRDGTRTADTVSDAHGKFVFAKLDEGRYQIEVHMPGFAPRRVDPFFVGGAVTVDVTLQLGLQQDVVVTASATEVPASQIGAAVTVIDRDTIDALGKPDVLESLRLVPGTNVAQTGARGGATSLFVRGGAPDFNKVLIDGVAANDIGGAFDFANVAATGVDRIEMLRNPNSVLHGTDAVTGVIDLTTKKGSSRVPEVSVSADGGNFNTSRGDASVGGAMKRFDYFADVSHFGTDNSLPNNAYHNTTVASRFGVALNSASSLSVTVRRTTSEAGNPNGIDLFGIADDSSARADATYVSATYEAQLNNRWLATARFGSMEQGQHTVNPTPTGQPFDPFGSGANYLGHVVTLTGANGDSVTGQAILDFSGTYPSDFDASSKRQTESGQVSGHLADWLDLSLGGRVEHEDGFTLFDGSRSATSRNNAGAFVEARTAFTRAFVTAGLGYDHNAIFKSAVTPRVTAAYYLHRPSSKRAFGATKLTMNAGTGIKAPSISQELSSLYTLVQTASSEVANSVSPIGPERSRSVDVGVEQELFGGRATVRAAFFDNHFSHLIEFVDAAVLPQLGIPPAAAVATGFGAYVNSSSYWARGLETSGDLSVGAFLKVTGSYTHLRAVVTQSLQDGVLEPAINPAFPDIPIGQFAPLVGAAPFRRPANTGSLFIVFTKGRGQVALSGFFAGKSDDSTFLDDGFFGASMLLPNHNLDAAYQKIDLSAAFRLHPRVRWFVSIENLSDRAYEAAFGFPALPRSFRTGVTILLGGDHRP